MGDFRSIPLKGFSEDSGGYLLHIQALMFSGVFRGLFRGILTDFFPVSLTLRGHPLPSWRLDYLFWGLTLLYQRRMSSNILVSSSYLIFSSFRTDSLLKSAEELCTSGKMFNTGRGVVFFCEFSHLVSRALHAPSMN